MAERNIKTSSDIDLLIITRRGRIFTARFFALLITYLSGKKRSNNDRNHEGKFCLNYFITDYSLIIPHNRSEEINRYCAKNYSSSVLLAGSEEIFKNFVYQNVGWMSRYVSDYNFRIFDFQKKLTPGRLCHSNRRPCHSERSEESVLTRSFVPLRMTLLEEMLSGKVGDCIEQTLKNIQTSKINKDPRTQKYPDLIVVNDRELRFHPPK